MPPRASPLLWLCLSGAFLAAQEPTPNGAGFGAIYADVAADPQTGAVLHLGVAVDDRGEFFVSAAGPGGLPPHRVFHFDRSGALLGSFLQPPVHQTSPFGLRDLDGDGQHLLGGSEAGISVFTATGAPAPTLLAANGPQPVVQPITGPWQQLLPVARAVAFDRDGDQGNGSLLLADFGSPIVEIDLAGNVLRSWPNAGWSAYGLAIDPATGNPWVFAGPRGEIEELDRATMQPTGRSLPPIGPGAPGGLAPASRQAGHHAAWPNQGAFVHLVQGAVDRFAVQRLHLFPGRFGWDEPVLEFGTNGGPRRAGVVPFGPGDVLDFAIRDPLGTRNGLPAWLIFNVYLDANRDAVTDLSPLLPGTGVLWEHRSLNAISVPSTPNFVVAPVLIGQPQSWQLPPITVLLDRDLFRMQGLYTELLSPQQGIASTNAANWQARVGERGIVVAASGPNSFNGGSAPPFWTVHSDLTHGHGAILAVEFSTVQATGPAALQRFDIDQNAMNDRFDGGNSAQPGFLGTYRQGSAAACGLDFAAPGVYRAPFHGPGESCGAAFAVPPDAQGLVPDLRFRFTAFGPGRTFAFDCDTDGGGPNGADHVGLAVRVTTANSGVLTGLLQVDPLQPERAVVWFP